MFNADTAPVDFVLPPSPHLRPWRLAADTFQTPPDDVCTLGEEAVVNPTSYVVEARSSVVRVAR